MSNVQKQQAYSSRRITNARSSSNSRNPLNRAYTPTKNAQNSKNQGKNSSEQTHAHNPLEGPSDLNSGYIAPQDLKLVQQKIVYSKPINILGNNPIVIGSSSRSTSRTNNKSGLALNSQRAITTQPTIQNVYSQNINFTNQNTAYGSNYNGIRHNNGVANSISRGRSS